MSDRKNLSVMRCEHAKTVAMSNIQAREIRILELHEEIERCKADMVAQEKVIKEAENQIAIHVAEKQKVQ